MPNLGATLLIANPVAQNGHGAAAARMAAEHLGDALSAGVFNLALTEAPDHGRALAAAAATYDTVVALGGDGLINEVVNGLMAIPASSRPALGVLPMGSGNDYALTLGMSFRLEESLAQVLDADPRAVDLGLCNERYFVETLSFGLDAAIALDTVDRRKRTGKTGTRLFLESGIDMLLHQLKEHRCTVRLDGEAARVDTVLLFAIQIGPTYGGGFRICPEARIDDGLLDLCIAHSPLGIPKAVMMFLLAKNAHHTGFKNLEFKQVSKMTIQFDDCPPAQIDGEPFPAESYDVSVVPAALRVLFPCS